MCVTTAGRGGARQGVLHRLRLRFVTIRDRGNRVNVLDGPGIEQQIDDVVIDLTKEFEGKVGPERIQQEVMTVYGRFSDSKIMTYVPLLTRRVARESLRHVTV